MTVTYRGMNADGTGTRTDADQLWQSIRDILTTPLGTRVMRRNYGSVIPDLLDEPQNDVTRLRLMSATAIALAQWEPRIALSAAVINFSDGGAVTVALTGLITATMEPAGHSIQLRDGVSANGNR